MVAVAGVLLLSAEDGSDSVSDTGAKASASRAVTAVVVAPRGNWRRRFGVEVVVVVKALVCPWRAQASATAAAATIVGLRSMAPVSTLVVVGAGPLSESSPAGPGLRGRPVALAALADVA